MTSLRRIALVVPDVSTSGGVSTVAHFLWKVLQKSTRFDVDLYSVALSSEDRASVHICHPSTWLGGIEVMEEQVEAIPYQHVGAFVSEVESFRYLPRRALTERLNGYDLVQIVAGTPAWSHLSKYAGITVALQVATLAREERASTLQGPVTPVALWRRAMTRVTDWLDHSALKHVDVAFVENQWMYDYLLQYLNPDQVVFAPPGVDTERFTPGSPPSDGEYLLSVGRLADARKNVRLLFEAYAKLCDRLRTAPPLVLAGRTPPPLEAWNRAETLGIRSSIRFLEDVPPDDLSELYRNAFLYVVSSDEEGLGLTILEAMASGRPVISTDCGGPSTTVVEGETGFLTPVGDADALACAIGALLSEPGRADAMGKKGRQRVESNFSLQVTQDRFLSTYESLLS